MTRTALSSYHAAREQRLGKNDARRILWERDKARSPTSGSDRRWPFELLQNAHDPGPRDGLALVELHFTRTESTLVFKHNGRPFTEDDLAALLSGGSNKEYDSVETTGRFGTGFLVTHVLSPRISLRGLLAQGSQYERFQVDLDRSGDEDAILEDTRAAESGIEAAVPVGAKDGAWTAEFEYPIDAPEAADHGIQAVRLSAPFLFGTCEHLGRVTIEGPDGLSEKWSPDSFTEYDRQGITVRERLITLESRDPTAVYRVLRLTPAGFDNVGLVVLLRANGEHWELTSPPHEIPRVFSRFPVRASTFLPINGIVDGAFQVQGERDRIAMGDDDRRRMAAALHVIPAAVQLGLTEHWEHVHKLGRVARVDRGFSETTSEEELTWWNHELREIADQLARLPLVRTTTGFLPAVVSGDDSSADFVVPRYNQSITEDEFPEVRAWELAANTTVLYPPVQELVSDWNELSAGWQSLGTPVTRRGLAEIADKVRGHARQLGDLPVRVEPREWLARYLDVISMLPTGHDRADLVTGLLPNQTHDADLCSPAQLKRDTGITVELKDIAESIGAGVRARLLDEGLARVAPPMMIEKLVPAELNENDVLRECVERLSNELPDGRDVSADVMPLVEGCIRLLGYLWTRLGVEGAALARRCPLLTRAGSVAHHTSKKIMGPVLAWSEKARPFDEIYAPTRVLADAYVERSTESCDVPGALVAWGIAFPEPLLRDTRSEVPETLLRELTTGDARGITLRNEEFSQVALLSTEIIQRCQGDEVRAALLLGFVLAYLAPTDRGWRQTRPMVGQRAGTDVSIEVCDALWIADLKSRAWVPMRGENGNEQVVPTAASLEPLLQSCKEWLVGNEAAIEFLIKWFGFDVLSLRLEALPEGAKDQIAERLATLVQLGGSNPDIYNQVVESLETRLQREREKERNRQFGLAVQKAIQSYLTERGLSVTVIDHGYDLDVEVPEVPILESGTHACTVGPFLVEVKATTTGEVRLTPAQAKAASTKDDFVLCVVDLRSCDSARLAQPWEASDVEPLAHMVTGLRETVNETHELIEAATEQEIALRNAGLLRYGVPPTVWEAGKAIRPWVEEIAPTLVKG